MPEDVRLPDLMFPRDRQGSRETPWDLAILLYRGGAKARSNHVGRMIAMEQLGKPLLDRIELVEKLHECIHGALVGGGSNYTTANVIRSLRAFFSWSEENGHALTIDSVQKAFLGWADSLIRRTRTIKDMRLQSAYEIGARVGCVESVPACTGRL